jgi:hypothetical protein
VTLLYHPITSYPQRGAQVSSEAFLWATTALTTLPIKIILTPIQSLINKASQITLKKQQFSSLNNEHYSAKSKPNPIFLVISRKDGNFTNDIDIFLRHSPFCTSSKEA